MIERLRVRARQKQRENVLLRSKLSVLTLLIRCPFHPELPEWHVKDPGHSAESAAGRLHLNKHTPLTQPSRSGLTMLSRHSVGSYQGNDLIYATRQGTLGHSHLGSLSHGGLVD